MILRLTRLCLAASFAAALTLGAQPQAPAVPNVPDVPNPGELVGPIKLPDADIDTVLGALEIYTGRSILRPQALPAATYNLKIDKQIPKSEAILAIETILELNGIGIVPMDENFLKAVALQNVRTEAPQMITGSALDLPPSSRVATKIFMLNFLRVDELVQQIQGMLTPNIGGVLSVVRLPNANAALITDTVTNLQRIETLLKQVDQPVTGNLTPKFYVLKHATASDLVARLNAIVAPLRAQLGTGTTFTADDRTGQIILISHPAQRAFFDSLIEKLDVQADPNTSNAVIPLKHAVATDVATLLSNVVSGQNAAVQRAASNSLRPGQGIAGATGLNAGFNNGVTLPNGVNVGGPNQALIGNQPQPVVIRPNLGATEAANLLENTTGSSRFSSLITIQADVRSNSVVVSGTGADIAMIKAMIDKLDVVLAQVSIQVVIAEVSLTDSDVSGISALNLTVGTDTPAGPGGDNGRGTHITNFAGTVGGWNITSGVVNPLSFIAALQNNGAKNNVKVLQANTIITEHNIQGEFAVQQQQPTVSAVVNTAGTTATGGTTTNSSIVRIPVGIDVKVTPLIGADGSIELKIDQVVDDIDGFVTVASDQPDQPVIAHREANVTVNVNDGQMIVLGGLQSNKRTLNRQKVGFFYEIPILSHLLGARNNETDRRELLLFVRPHVLPPSAGTADTDKKIDEMSNKEDVKAYLNDAAKMPEKKFSERVK